MISRAHWLESHFEPSSVLPSWQIWPVKVKRPCYLCCLFVCLLNLTAKILQNHKHFFWIPWGNLEGQNFESRRDANQPLRFALLRRFPSPRGNVSFGLLGLHPASHSFEFERPQKPVWPLPDYQGNHFNGFVCESPSKLVDNFSLIIADDSWKVGSRSH